MAGSAGRGCAPDDHEHLQESGRAAVGTHRDDDVRIAERLDAIAYPGLTANFDAAKSASLAITLLDWKAHGPAYAAEMVASAAALAESLIALDVPVHGGSTESHAFAVNATQWGGGHAAALRLRQANLLTRAIGLPHDLGAGLRIGTNEAVRWGMTSADIPELAELVARGLADPSATATDVTALLSRFTDLHFLAPTVS